MAATTIRMSKRRFRWTETPLPSLSSLSSLSFFVVFVIFVVFVVFVIKFIPQCHSWVDFNAFAEISGYSESNPILFAHLFQLWVANVAEVGKFAIYFALVNVCTLICKRKESLWLVPRIPHLEKRTFQKTTSTSTALPAAQNKTPNVRSKVYEASLSRDRCWNRKSSPKLQGCCLKLFTHKISFAILPLPSAIQFSRS